MNFNYNYYGHVSQNSNYYPQNFDNNGYNHQNFNSDRSYFAAMPPLPPQHTQPAMNSQVIMHNPNVYMHPPEQKMQNSVYSNEYTNYNHYNYHDKPESIPLKVLVNPHFKKTVYINPNFNKANVCGGQNNKKIHVNPKNQNPNLESDIKKSIHLSKSSTILANSTKVSTENTMKNESLPKNYKIHINPKMHSDKINESIRKAISATTNGKNIGESREIHVNPNLLKVVDRNSDTLCGNGKEKPLSKPGKKIVLTRNKLIRVPESKISISSPSSTVRKRRNSIVSAYKIIKSSVIPSYKTVKNSYRKVNKFQIDNRVVTSKPKLKLECSFIRNRKKYVYVNKFISISDIAKSSLLKNVNKIKKHGFINIGGVVYKKSVNSLRRADSIKTQNKVKKSKYKFVRKALTPSKQQVSVNVKITPRQLKIVRKIAIKKVSSPSKLRTCNVPCPIYRKFGRCLGKERGTCYRKHNPNQIVLCTRFLQGACVNDKCPLSHKVSPEKMPTCKYYLEGSCSKDNCPYLHVRISPKADICRDFLEGYCEKAAQCDKRHQLLCPEYEKNGSCPKKRCPYPHGSVVRKYTVQKSIAKKCSRKKENPINKDKASLKKPNKTEEPSTSMVDNAVEKNARYYSGSDDLKSNANSGDLSKNEIVCEPEIGFRSRPKLGELPSYIPLFEEK